MSPTINILDVKGLTYSFVARVIKKTLETSVTAKLTKLDLGHSTEMRQLQNLPSEPSGMA